MRPQAQDPVTAGWPEVVMIPDSKHNEEIVYYKQLSHDLRKCTIVKMNVSKLRGEEYERGSGEVGRSLSESTFDFRHWSSEHQVVYFHTTSSSYGILIFIHLSQHHGAEVILVSEECQNHAVQLLTVEKYRGHRLYWRGCNLRYRAKAS